VSGEALFVTVQATTTIPIVSATGGGDLVKAGLIQSLRPGGNVTGMWLTSDEAAALRRSALMSMLPLCKARKSLNNEMVFLHRRLQQDHPEQSKQGSVGF
jgi:hypothetical protein